MQTKLAAALVIGLSGAITCLGFSPAQAGPNPPLSRCIRGTLDMFLFGGCSRGDLNFLFNSYSGGPPSEVEVSISGSGNTYVVNLLADYLLFGAGHIDYIVEVNDRSTDLLASLTGSQSTTQVGSIFTGRLTASGTNSGSCGSAIPVSSWSCAATPLTFPFGMVSTNVLHTWNAPLGLDIITNTIHQQYVPGPLPIVGAAMAFRISRKLRHQRKSRP